MTEFVFFTYQDDAGRWYWQRSGRFKTFDADQQFATQHDATKSALACARREFDELAAYRRQRIGLAA